MLNQLCEGVWDFFFPSDGAQDELIITAEEKQLIVTQIRDVKHHLSKAQNELQFENFDEATDEVVEAIEASTCARCKKKMTITAHDIVHAKNVCELGGDQCNTLKITIDGSMEDFKENYLPKVEEVLKAKEHK